MEARVFGLNPGRLRRWQLTPERTLELESGLALVGEHASTAAGGQAGSIGARRARRLAKRGLRRGGRLARWRGRRAAMKLVTAVRCEGDPGAASALALIACAHGNPLAGEAGIALVEQGADQRIVDILADHWARTLVRHPVLTDLLSLAAACPTAVPRNVSLLLRLGRLKANTAQFGEEHARMLVAALDDRDDRIRAAAANLLARNQIVALR